MKKALQIRNHLNEAISHIYEKRDEYCTRRTRDFTRVRKLSFDTVMRIIITMVNRSLQPELAQYFDYKEDCPTKSAFIQQRQKISPEAFRAVFDDFSALTSMDKRFLGYRLLACDGTDVNLPRNPEDFLTSVHTKPDTKSYNMLHINALYDLVNAVYADYSIDFGATSYETKALLQMIRKLPDKLKTIIVADRGYGYLICSNHFSYNSSH